MRYAYSIIGLLLSLPCLADYPVYTVERQGIVHNSNMGTAFPGLAEAANGDLLAQFNTTNDGYPGGKSYLVRSTDGGATWNSPVLLAEVSDPTATVLTDIGLSTLFNGNVMFTFTEARKIVDAPNHYSMYPYFMISSDSGYTWTPPKRLPGLEGGMGSPFGRPAITARGDILQAMWLRYAWADLGLNLDNYKVSWGHSGYTRSRDGGVTWEPVVEIGPYGETSILALADGSFLTAGKRNGAQQMTRFTHSDSGSYFQELDTHYFLGGKNASLHNSPNSIVLSFMNYEGRGHILFTLNKGQRWYTALDIHPLLEANGVGEYGYGINAINLDAERMMLIYYAQDPSEMDPGNPFTPSHAYVGYMILRETIRPGDPPQKALTDTPVNTVTTELFTAGSKPIVYPCPWRSDQHTGRDITFAHLPEAGEVKIYTISGELVRTVDIRNSEAKWDRTNSSGSTVASGVYLYLVRGSNGEKGRGKFVVIK